MTSDGRGEIPATQAAIRHALLEQLLEDDANGAIQNASHYVSLFPEHADLVLQVVDEISTDRRGVFEGRNRIGHYVLIDEIGRGGQGTVFLARDTRLSRVVALKLVSNAGQRLGPLRLERFRREAQAASRLDHPGICAVYETGEVDDVLFLAMRHVAGDSLALHIARAQSARDQATTVLDLPTRDEDSGSSPRQRRQLILRLIEEAARALHVAHEAGIVHRDIKPGNIMVDKDGNPVLLDFGLARDTEDPAPDLTDTNDVFGTPSYMALEQLRPGNGRVDRRADVYALGVTLFECLTLCRPHEGRNPVEIADAQASGSVPDIRQFASDLPLDLAVVIQCALAPNRNERYSTAHAFAEDLRAVREWKPINARSAGFGLRLWRWTQRNPVLAATQALLFLSLSVGLVISLLAYGTAQRERDRADRGSYASRMVSASSQRHADPYGALRLLNTTEPTRRGSEWHLLKALIDDAEHLFELPVGSPRACGYTASGRRIVAYADNQLVKVIDFDSGDVIRTLACPSVVNDLVLSHDCDRLAVACVSTDNRPHRRLLVIATRGGEPLFDQEHKRLNARSLRFTEDGRFLISRDKPRTCIDLEHGTWKNHKSKPGTARLSPTDATYHVRKIQYDMATGEPTGRRIPFDLRRPSPNGSYIASTQPFVRWLFLDATLSNSPPRRLLRYRGQLQFVQWSADSSKLVSGSREAGRIVVHDSTNWRIARDLRVPWTTKSPPVLRPDGNALLLCTARGVEEFSTVRSGRILGPHDDFVTAVAFSPDGSLVASCTTQGTVWLWDPDTGQALGAPRQLTKGAQLEGIAFTADGLSVQGMDPWTTMARAQLIGDPAALGRSERFFDAENPDQTWQQLAPGSRLTRGWVSSRNRKWSTGPRLPLEKQSWKKAVTELHAAAGSSDLPATRSQPEHVPGSQANTLAAMNSLAWHKAAEGSLERAPEVAQIATGLSNYSREHISIAMDWHSTRLAYGHKDGAVLVFDLATGQLLRVIDAHVGPTLSLAFTKDGRLLTGGMDRVLNIWDPETGDQLASLREHVGSIECIAVSPDGTRFATASADRTIRLWDTLPVWQRRRNAQATKRALLPDRLPKDLTAASRNAALQAIWQAPSLSLQQKQALRNHLLR